MRTRHDARPTLWQIPISHYSEKVRWALEYKGVSHLRRSPVPGAHMPLALWLSGGSSPTLPILKIDGEAVCGSAQIIDVLEQRFRDPALYPADPAERGRAKDIAAWLDRDLGPAVRRLAFFELRSDPERLAAIGRLAAPALPAPMRVTSNAYTRAFTALRYRAGSASEADRAREAIHAGVARIEQELGEGEYLVGGAFSSADLTASALLSPLFLPPESAMFLTSMPESYERFRSELAGGRAYRWAEDVFRRHRHGRPAAAHAAGALAGSDAVI